MLEEELKKIWKGSTKEELVKFNKSKLLLQLDYKLEKLERAIWWRDWRELAGVVLTVPILIFGIIVTQSIIAKAALVYLILTSLFVVYKLKSVKKLKPKGTDVPLIHYLKAEKKYLLTEMRLTDNILYWYLLPLVFGISIFFLSSDITIMQLIIRFFVLIVGYYAIFRLNKRAVKKHYMPIIDKLTKIINKIED